ncbi:HD domain-containing protein [Erythrobacter sp. BLCC-B19]|uniref:HD domain-containing protein n=1 Tax=Erythrobacter sp. BLCC-B19 TaxID=3025315 RepID=UPI002360D794|nr:HD domain-containing protein [Erythrobacter sp. BLCC-B19]WDA41700.1 HD domain-containing protein [Erythrobacter sp. BLCC-B19]
MTDAPFLTERFDDALAYASRLHRAQTRKGSGIPYVSHLLAVAAIALENGADEDQAIAALLHDAVEDQGGLAQLKAIRERYGEGVAQIVADCTDSHQEPKPAWHPRKEAYIASLAHKPPRSLAVSLADKTHNAAAINADLRGAGEAVWSRFTGGKGGTLWYYRALANAFRAHAAGLAAERFAREVDEMEELAVRD